MCRAIRFHFDEHTWEVRFTQTGAKLPVRLSNGEAGLQKWGKRPHEKCPLPVGGWARFAHVQAGRWDQYGYKKVLIPAREFMVQDVLGHEHWFKTTVGQYLRGVVVKSGNDSRLYVVIMDSPPDQGEFEGWPRVITAL